MFRFLVIADSHIRFPDDGADEYPSNALMADRNRYVVNLCNRLDPEFVVHLGDIVHPLPTEGGHEEAVRLSVEIYDGLDAPIHFVAGNHDIGDKPDSLVAVPPVAEEHYGVFEAYWGRPFGSFQHARCHFVIVDTPVLGSGLKREAAQRSWLEQDLAGAVGKRTFVFTHYPPFVQDAGESEHYDNLAAPAREWLLDLCRDHGVEAVFSGHVHNFITNRHHDTDLYVLPSTGFVRPDYSEMAAIAPERERGRDEPAKLGVFVVEVTEDGHFIQPIRTHGLTSGKGPIDPAVLASPGWRSPVGVTLRHGWAATHDLPTEGLDEFRRKTVRNDYPLLALREARIDRVRIPIGDVLTSERSRRVRDLAAQGMRFTVSSAGVPDPQTLVAIEELSDVIGRWELILPADALTRIPRSPVPLAVAPIVPIGGPGHHFVSHGFDPFGDVPDLRCDELVFRIGWDRPVEEGVEAGVTAAAQAGKGAVVNLQLPRNGEAVPFTDDDAVAARVVEAVRSARSHPDAVIFLDTFMDHDRGYYPRHGLIDRRFDPRPALYALITEAAK